MAEVRLQEGESLESALRRFKRKVQTEDIIKEVKRHSYYLKPGEKMRIKQALARKRSRKKSAARWNRFRTGPGQAWPFHNGGEMKYFSPARVPIEYGHCRRANHRQSG